MIRDYLVTFEVNDDKETHEILVTAEDHTTAVKEAFSVLQGLICVEWDDIQYNIDEYEI